MGKAGLATYQRAKKQRELFTCRTDLDTQVVDIHHDFIVHAFGAWIFICAYDDFQRRNNLAQASRFLRQIDREFLPRAIENREFTLRRQSRLDAIDQITVPEVETLKARKNFAFVIGPGAESQEHGPLEAHQEVFRDVKGRLLPQTATRDPTHTCKI